MLPAPGDDGDPPFQDLRGCQNGDPVDPSLTAIDAVLVLVPGDGRRLAGLQGLHVSIGFRDGSKEGLELRVADDVLAASGAQASTEALGLLLDLLQGLGAIGETMGGSNGPIATVPVSSKVKNPQHMALEVDLGGLSHLMPERCITGRGVGRCLRGDPGSRAEGA
eukprot:13101312-Alexandrium_andersonii.AAC.1